MICIINLGDTIEIPERIYLAGCLTHVARDFVYFSLTVPKSLKYITKITCNQFNLELTYGKPSEVYSANSIPECNTIRINNWDEISLSGIHKIFDNVIQVCWEDRYMVSKLVTNRDNVYNYYLALLSGTKFTLS